MDAVLTDLAGAGPVAQLVEHLTFNQVVAGSIPAGLTIFCLPLDFASLNRSDGAANNRRAAVAAWVRVRDIRSPPSFLSPA